MPEFSYPVGWTNIANLALRTLTSKLIQNLNDGSPNANFCREFMGKAVQQVLTEEDWGSCKKRLVLNPLTETPAFGFAYYYQLPGDWIRFCRDKDRTTIIGVDTGGEPWELEGDRIATTASYVNLRYIANPTDPAKFSPYLRNAISSQLALMLCIPLAKSEELQAQIQGQYKIDLALSRKAEAASGAHVDESPTPAGAGWYDEAR